MRDAEDLVDLLRLGRLAEAWIAPPQVRELREIVRHRPRCVCLRTNPEVQVYSVLAEEDVSVPMTDLLAMAGTAPSGTVSSKPAYSARVESLGDLIESFDRQVAIVERDLRREPAGRAGSRAICVGRSPPR